MPTLTPQQIAIQKAMLESQPGIAFGNQDYRGSAVGDSQSPNGVNLAATYYPPTTDQTGKTIPGAQDMIDKINDGLNEQTYGTGSTPTDNWWDNLQQAIGNMGVGPGHGGGTYVPYAGQELTFEKQQNAQNQAYGQQYLDILSGKNTNTSADNKAKLYQAAVESAQKDPNWGSYDANDQQAAIEAIYNGMLAAYNSGSGANGSGTPSPGPAASGTGTGTPAAPKTAQQPAQIQTDIQKMIDGGTPLATVIANIAQQAKAAGATPIQVQTWTTWAQQYYAKTHPTTAAAPAAQAPAGPASIQGMLPNQGATGSINPALGQVASPNSTTLATLLQKLLGSGGPLLSGLGQQNNRNTQNTTPFQF